MMQFITPSWGICGPCDAALIHIPIRGSDFLMSTTDEAVTVESTEPTTDPVADEAVEPVSPEDPDAGAKKALVAERSARKAAERELAQMKAQLELKDRPAEEQALEQARAEARAEAKAKADARILKSELKAIAASKLADPSDAHLYIDLTQFEVDDDGEVDSDALSAAVVDLLARKPHLAAAGQPRFQGGGDGGSRPPAKPDVSLDEQIEAAQKARNFPLVATLKQQKAAKKG